MQGFHHMFYRTLSCRTSSERRLNAKRTLLLWILIGVSIGTVCFCQWPGCIDHLWCNHGFCVQLGNVCTLWDLFVQAVFPTLLVLIGILLAAGSAMGQPWILALLLSHGIAIGFSAAQCFTHYGFFHGLLLTGILILPHGFFTTLILVPAARDAIRLSTKLSAYLLHHAPDPDISTQLRTLLLKGLAWATLIPVSGALHTALTWLCADRFFVNLI